jgi:hypothetical protein
MVQAGEARNMSGIEGIGEAVTGGMIARSVEPAAGEAAGHQPGECLNCGAPLTGNFCHQCGQQAHVHRTMSAFWHDLLHSVLHFEGKIWRTLPMLAIYPGDLTRRYVDGERAKFVSPMALFLFSVFLMFAVFSAVGANLIGGDAVEAGRDIAAEVQQRERTIEELEQQRKLAEQQGRDVTAVDKKIEDVRAERDALMKVRLPTDKPLGDGFKTGWPRLDKGIAKANANPDLLFYKLQTNAYKFSWALIPLSVPFVWLLFLHRRRYRQEFGAYDHTVFVTYSITFMSMLLIAFVLLETLGMSDGWLVLALLLIPPVHMYRQLKGAYRLSRWNALWRTFALLNGAVVAMSLFTSLLLVLGVLG